MVVGNKELLDLKQKTNVKGLYSDLIVKGMVVSLIPVVKPHMNLQTRR
jgi:hypothetical protein